MCKKSLVLISNVEINCFTAFFGKQRSSGGLDVSLAFRYFGDRTNAVIETAYKYNTQTAQIQYKYRTNADFCRKRIQHGYILSMWISLAFWDGGQRTNTVIGWYGKIFISPILLLLEPAYKYNTKTEQIQYKYRRNTIQAKNKCRDWVVWRDFH